MNKESAKKRAEKLRAVINHHRYLYHVLDKQEISDSALDSLKRELYKLEQQYPDLITPDSPTQRVGGKPLDKFEKVGHRAPMLSIEDIFNEQELVQWQKYLKRMEPEAGLEYFCELKIDGLAISLIYDKGVLVCAATRGDGKTGEDVTQNIKTIESVPLNLQLFGVLPSKEIKDALKWQIQQGKIEIRGEVYMDKRSFEKINQERIKRGEEPYANPRNLAAGSIRQLDPKLAASRDLKFLGYDMVSDILNAHYPISHSQKHELLTCLGFKTEKGKICKTLAEIIDFWKKVQQNREKLPFQVDGAVVLVNDDVLFQKLGVIGKSPRGIRAFKFSPKQATTKIKDIRIQIGRTGAVTPVALLEPVDIGGATITRATLHNEDEIKRLGVKIGDTVIVERAGDVIPAVTKALPELRTGQERNFRFPKECPICRAKLIKPEGEVVWRCFNVNCPARKREFLEHFISKKGFNIEGLGPKIIEQLADNNLITHPSDIFDLKEGDLLPLERFAQKSARKLVAEIQNKKEIPLSRFIYTLGIRHIGEETALDLANRFKDLEKIPNFSLEELQLIPNIGQKVAQSIYNWFRNKENRQLIAELKKKGVKILPPAAISGKLGNKIFVITGVLETMSREESQGKIRGLGGNMADSVSKKTDFLIAGENPGSKLEKARKLGVKIIDEKEFLRLIR